MGGYAESLSLSSAVGPYSSRAAGESKDLCIKFDDALVLVLLTYAIKAIDAISKKYIF